MVKEDPKEETFSGESGHLALRKARHQLQTGETTAAEYRDLKDQVVRSSAFAPATSYASLTQSVSGLPQQRNENGDAPTSETSGFLTIKGEEQYLQSLDAYLDGDAATPRSHAVNSLGARNSEKTAERERETQLRNPVSVYNWLRKNKPSVFLQDNEPNADKPPRQAGSRSSKRTAGRDSIVKQEEEMYDEDGIAVDTSTLRGKRKRDHDGGYRPKGGNSRPMKRKKEDTASGRRSKKSSIDVR
jgi:IEC3 subunit of the Ino80 complex, chromatin re-modelling